MVFSRLFFLYFFFPICLIAYAGSGNLKNKNTVLIIFSLIFYAWGEPFYILLLILSSFINYVAGLVIGRFQGTKIDMAATAVTVTYDILMLGIFKYSGFIVENINAFFNADFSVPNLKLPIGISFYTFQIISYIIDCHWETVKPQKSFFKFLMYVSLFPQLVAGPIVRYSTIEKEIDNRKTTVKDISYGFNRLIIGLSKKVLIANNLGIVVDNFLKIPENSTFIGTWLGAVLYAMQIYYDFSGYSDMAIGMGRIFGFHFDENFNYPFICKDVTEFWQRWHISLGSFFRDYLLYVPIFGKRRKYGGLFLVWFCTGLWHGASWNFIIWGLYNGIFIFIEMKIGKKKMKKIPLAIRHIYNKIVIVIGFGIFYFEDFGKLGRFLKNIFGFGGNGFIAEYDKMTIVNNEYLILIALIFCLPIIPMLKKLCEKSYPIKTAASVAAMCICSLLLITSSIMLVDATNNPFLYFRF